MVLLPIQRRNRNELGSLHRDMDDLFRSFFGSWPTSVSEGAIWPAIDVAESENEITVKAEVPGCKAEDVDITVQGNTLVISGEKKQEEEKKEKGYYHLERNYGTFRREMSLPTDVDTAGIEANCKDGVLTVKLPKTEKAKSIKVKVKGQ